MCTPIHMHIWSCMFANWEIEQTQIDAGYVGGSLLCFASSPACILLLTEVLVTQESHNNIARELEGEKERMTKRGLQIPVIVVKNSTLPVHVRIVFLSSVVRKCAKSSADSAAIKWDSVCCFCCCDCESLHITLRRTAVFHSRPPQNTTCSLKISI